ncbi:hypothetical protein LTR53_000970 [Teratosphaeriaceae sp. CCFEE 6253]|nr:hypothetical protein LTR53_000970 [Teratosphaeriaceae sp. CCFEE 6253]
MYRYFFPPPPFFPYPYPHAGVPPPKKYTRELKRSQRKGVVGPLMPAPMLGPYGAVALPPWTPGWRPPGGFYWEDPRSLEDKMKDTFDATPWQEEDK